MSSQQAASEYARAGRKVCVLNFASSVNPGGGVTRVASAQEECLCRYSTLYFCLNIQNLWNKFYKPHRAPNLRREPSNLYNPEGGRAVTGLTEDKLKTLLQSRIRRIFRVAIANGAEVLILGTFGCGAFRNPPKLVAEWVPYRCYFAGRIVETVYLTLCGINI